MNVIGHNRPPLDLPDGFEIDYGQVVMDRAFYHPDLKTMIDGDRLLLVAIGFGMKRGCPKTRMSLSYANKLMDESESTTQERFKRLRKLGWLKCIPGRGSRPTEWELDLPPTEYEAAIRNAVEVYNAKRACSVPVYKGATGSSLPTDWGTRRENVMTDRGNTEWASQSLPANRETRRISSPRSAPVDPSWPTGGPVPTKELNRQTVSREGISGDPGQVLPLRDDPTAMALHRVREERFGPGLMSSAERLASFLQVGCPEALDLMDAHQGSVSPGVVLNAIARLDLRGLDRNGLPIKDRKTWFENGIGFARADADGDWLEAPKVGRDPRRSQPYNSNVDENDPRTKKLDEALALVRKQDGIR